MEKVDKKNNLNNKENNINLEINELKNKIKSESLIQLVTFKIDNELYGIEILKIQEIVRLPDITRLPKAADFIRGVINLRGNIVPVIDLRVKFGLPQKRYTKMTRAIVVEIEQKRIALIVDEVSQVLRIDSSAIMATPALVSQVAKEFIESVAKFEDQLVIILKINKILTTSDIIELEKIGD
jgi:purine-binding chemotaxis protein CheW